jgi:hypothetical protein
MALSLILDRPAQSLDVTSAYLQADLQSTEEYYVSLPAEVIMKMNQDELRKHEAVYRPVYRLRKALYGLQRSAFDWITRLITHLKTKGWEETAFDAALLVREWEGIREMICIYVDDILLLTVPSRCKVCWREVLDEFEASDPAECREYIGVRFPTREVDAQKCMEVEMRDYVNSIVTDFDKEGKPSVVSYITISPDSVKELQIRRSETTGQTTEGKALRRVQGYVGRLMWLARTGRPDISHAVGILASVTGIWSEVAEKELRRLVGYLKHTRDISLCYQIRKGVAPPTDTHVQFKVYVDASLQDPRSYSGGAITVGVHGAGECMIEWWSRKQKIAVVSSMMAEVIALMDGVVEAAPLRELSKFPIRVLCDNQAAIKVVSHGHSRAMSMYSRPLRLRICTIRDMIELEQIDVVYVPTKDNMSDIFTKVFARYEQARLTRLAGMRAPARVGDEITSEGNWVISDKEEERGAQEERAAQKREHIKEARQSRQRRGDSAEGAGETQPKPPAPGELEDH